MVLLKILFYLALVITLFQVNWLYMSFQDVIFRESLAAFVTFKVPVLKMNGQNVPF